MKGLFNWFHLSWISNRRCTAQSNRYSKFFSMKNAREEHFLFLLKLIFTVLLLPHLVTSITTWPVVWKQVMEYLGPSFSLKIFMSLDYPQLPYVEIMIFVFYYDIVYCIDYNCCLFWWMWRQTHDYTFEMLVTL